ncbi:MAG: LytR C-terminal domain-containing protein [Clostridiales bacterium]|nr:LytR C-terminal domain-containing protein [Clostridiales bacterium]
MNKKAKKKFVRTFVRSFAVMAVMIGAAGISYAGTKAYYHATGKTPGGLGNKIETLTPQEMETAAKNVVISEDGEKVTGIVVEVFNTSTGNLDYLTIPAETRITLSDALYQKFVAKEIDIPQIVSFYDLESYFGKDNLGEGMLYLINDYLDSDIQYYTLMSDDTFRNHFDKDEEQSWKLSDSCKEELEGLSSEEEIKEYIKEQYENVTSNLYRVSKQQYAEYMEQIDLSLVHTHMLPGQDITGEYQPNQEKARQLWEQILNADTYVSADERLPIEDNSSSIGLRIRIQNGSGITGLAAAFKTKLETDGHTIVAAENAPVSGVTTTEIHVKDSSVGRDLETYFNSPVYVTEDNWTDADSDIIIILGTADRQ